MRILMKYVECVARRHSCWIEKNKDRTNKNVNDMWERIGNRFIIDHFRKTSGKRKETLWKTIYNRLSLAKEFLKEGRTIYTQNPKDIIPIAVERPSSPPGNKDPPQIVTLNDVAETNSSTSPPGIKDPPQVATIVQNNEFSEILGEDSTLTKDNSTLTMLTNISTESDNSNYIADDKVIQLTRNAVGMFGVTNCETCPVTTQHRRQYPVLNGKCFDVDMGIQICRRAICNLCLRESAKIRRCRYHRSCP